MFYQSSAHRSSSHTQQVWRTSTNSRTYFSGRKLKFVFQASFAVVMGFQLEAFPLVPIYLLINVLEIKKPAQVIADQK